MDMIKEAIEEWLREILVGGIINNLSGLFDSVNEKVGEISTQVGMTPQGWNSGIFNMIKNLSDSVILPIAGLILAFVMTLELIQLITDKNNMHDVDTWMFFKWIFKTACAVLIVTNTWNIVMGIFEAAQSVVNRAAGIIMKPTNGMVLYNGTDIRQLGESYRAVFGFLPQDFGYSRDFTVKDYLEYMAALKDVPADTTRKKINELLDILTLSDVKNKKISKLSGGMRRRVGIAQAMLNDPEVLILDEPTAGLDPGERVRFRNFISEFAHNRIVLISTHIVSDVEYIATQTAIMKDGRVVDVGTTDQLVKEIEGKVWSCTVPARTIPELEMRLRIINQRGEDNEQVSIRYLSEKAEVENSKPASPRLEDLYLWLFPNEEKDKEVRYQRCFRLFEF